MGLQLVRADDMPTDRSAIEADGVTTTVAHFHASPGPPGAWHHHGEQRVIAYVISGSVRIEWGPGGRMVTEPGPGDMVHIEPGTIHRELYEGEVALAGFIVGGGPGRVDVDGPEPA